MDVKDGAQRPPINIFESAPRHPRASPFEFYKNNLKKLADQINGFPKRSGTGIAITENILVERLLPGSANFGKALERSGNPIENAASWVEQARAQRATDDEAATRATAAAEAGSSDQEDAAEKDARNERLMKYDKVNALVNSGKQAAQATYELRLLDQERDTGGKRHKMLKEYLGIPKLGIENKGPNQANGMVPGKYEVFDADKTTAFGVTKEQITAAVDRYNNMDQKTREHVAVLKAAKTAKEGAGCPP